MRERCSPRTATRTLRAWLRQVHGCLPGGVAAADHEHVLVAVALLVGRHRGVVEAGAAVALDARGSAARASALRSPSRACAPARAGRRRDRRAPGPRGRRRARRRGGSSRSTASKRRACSVAARVRSAAGDAGGEAEVVLDARAGARLPARGPGLGDERAQALGAAVDRGREPRRPGAQHDDVEALAVDLRAQPEVARDLGGRRVAQDAVAVDEDGRLLARDVEPVEPTSAPADRRRRRRSAPAAGCARAGRAPRRRAASRARRSACITPCPASSCHARRASMQVPSTISASSGEPASIARSTGDRSRSCRTVRPRRSRPTRARP